MLPAARTRLCWILRRRAREPRARQCRNGCVSRACVLQPGCSPDPCPQVRADEEQAKAMAKVLSGDGSRKQRDAKAQKAQEERLAAKQLPAPVQPGTVRTKCGLTGTLLLFAEGERPYWEG